MTTLEKIQKLILEKFGTDKAFEDALGIPNRTVNDWKRGKSKSYMKLIPSIAIACGVSTDYLLMDNLTEEKNNPLDDEASNGKDKLEGVHFYTPPAHLRKSNYTPPASPIEGVWTDIKKSDEPGVDMDDLDREMLSLFQQLPQGERYKLIGRLEALLEKWK